MTRIIAKRPRASGSRGARADGTDGSIVGADEGEAQVGDTTEGAAPERAIPVDGTPDGDGADGEADPADAPGSTMLAGTGGAGERLDRFLAARLPRLLAPQFAGLSRTRLQRWIALGAVLVDGRARAARTRLTGIETIAVDPQPREADTAFVAEPVPLTIVWQDPALLVVDKPAGLVVHPAAGNWHGTMLNGLLHLDPALAELPRAGIVHRLDKDTSGLLVVARTEAAMAALSAQLADRSMGRRYLALVAGLPPASGLVDAPIGRDERSRVRMAAVAAPRGRASRTHFRRLAAGRLGARQVALLECRLDTGRTHQIRVHLAHLGFPLIGDALYGGPTVPGFARQALHAWQLSLLHPVEQRRRAWASPLPDDFRELLVAAGIEAPTVPDGSAGGDALPGGGFDERAALPDGDFEKGRGAREIGR